MKVYPSKWYRVEQRGCTPNGIGCLHMDWPLERCNVSPRKTVTRHIAPKSVLRYCLNAQLQGAWRTVKSVGTWTALGQRKAGGRVFRTTGRTEREALQNLCAEMKVTLP